MLKPKVGVVTFTDPRATSLSVEREKALREKHVKLKRMIESWGYDVVDVNEELGLHRELDSGGNFGINDKERAFRAGSILGDNDVIGTLVGLWHWTESNLVTAMVRTMGDKPVMLLADDDPSWAGTTCVTSVGASLWETWLMDRGGKPNHYRLQLKWDENLEELKAWLKAMETAWKLKRSVILIFGAPYTLGMEHLMDDLPALKEIVEDIIMLDQYLIVRRAEELLRTSRVDSFVNWLEDRTEINYDGKMLTRESLRRSVALYLATKDLVSEFSSDSNLGAVSLKCQPELSEVYGVTGCLVPALLPFPEDAEGEKIAVSTTCEGDVKGTISSLILELISGVPALFGDVKYISDEYILVANCGASSIYYAAMSDDIDTVLRAIQLNPQCQGASGAAVTYRTPESEFTALRLIRVKGRYYLQWMVTDSLKFTEEMERRLLWGRQWPHTALRNPLNSSLMLSILGANHLSMVPSSWQEVLRYLRAELNLREVNLGDEGSATEFLKELGY